MLPHVGRAHQLFLFVSNVSQTFWTVCLARLEQELPPQQFNTWIRALDVPEPAGSDSINIFAPNRFVLQWVRERYLCVVLSN